MTNRLPALEILESRCVLSGAGMPPMMEHFGDFAHGGDRGGHELRGPGPDFGGRDMRPEMPPPGFGEFGFPMQHGPERDFGSFAPPPRQPMFPSASDLHAERDEAAVIVTRDLAPPPVEASSPLPSLDRPSGGMQLPFTPAGMTSVAALSDGTLASSRESSSAVSLATVESQSQNAKSMESREEANVPKPQSKDSPAARVPKDDLDGLVELTANETSQRIKRKASQEPTVSTQTLADKPERLTTLALGSREEVRRLAQPEAASNHVLANWPASGPAWVPADTGLVEVLAGDIVSDARQSSAVSKATSVLRGSFPAGLKAEIKLYQAFDLAPEQAAVPVASAAPPQSSPESTQ
jgi:hypothetical protein